MGCKNRLTPANGKDVLKAKRMTPKRLYAKSEEMANLGKGEALNFMSLLEQAQSPMSAASLSATSPMSMAASSSEDIPMASEDVSEKLETQETDNKKLCCLYCVIQLNFVEKLE
ncbi:hypothetical protein BD560DRAFT_427078 [Blakeslea trispora]|nr:hypothetical protein BD560DRAFT_427078 [Blakeslea trispora]